MTSTPPYTALTVTFKDEFKVIEYGDVEVQYVKRSRFKPDALRVLHDLHINDKEPISLENLSLQVGSQIYEHPTKLFIHGAALDPTSKRIVELVVRWRKDAESNEWIVFLSPRYRYSVK